MKWLFGKCPLSAVQNNGLQFQQNHTRFETLLLHFVSGEKEPHRNGGVLADLLHPPNEPFSPGIWGAVLVETSPETQVERHTAAGKTYHPCSPGQTHISTCCLRHSYGNLIHTDVVVILGGGYLPDS